MRNSQGSSLLIQDYLSRMVKIADGRDLQALKLKIGVKIDFSMTSYMYESHGDIISPMKSVHVASYTLG